MASLGLPIAGTLKTKTDTFILPLAVILFALLRLIFMVQFPIFNDEALTIRYGKIAVETPYHFYTVIVGGKQPLLFWADGIMTHILPDPLFAGRIISFIFGSGTLAGVYAVTKKMSRPSLAKYAALAYAVSPVNLFYDGLAIHDAALVCIFIWIFYFLLSLGRQFSLLAVAAVGVLTGLGLWIKTTALLFLFVSCGLLLYFAVLKRLSGRQAGLAVLVWLFLITIMLLPLVLRPEFAGIIRMQSEYALTAQDIIKIPVQTWYLNLRSIVLVNLGYVSPLVFVSFFYALWKKHASWETISVVLGYSVTVAFLVLTGKSMHSRYMVFSVVLLFPLFALFWERQKMLYSTGVILMVVLSSVLALRPEMFFHLFPQRWVYGFEAFQYVDGWPSGYGVREALAYVDKARNGGPAFVGVRWDAGNPEDTVLLYAPKLPYMATGFFDQKLETFPVIVDKMKNYPMYLITRNDQRGGLDNNLTLVAKFYKPAHVESVEVYQYRPPAE